MAISHTWHIKFHTLKVSDAQEESLLSNGDEPYLIFFGLRSRPNTPGSTAVFWNNYLNDDWADGVDDGSQKPIPWQMGTLDFPDVILPTASEVLSSGKMPEILGFIGIAIESDATPFSSIRSLMNDVRDAIFVQVKKLVENGQLDPNNPGSAIQKAIQDVQSSLNPSTWEKIKLFLSSFADPDDVIGIQAKMLVAGDPSLKPIVAAEFLEQKELQLTFSGDGATYQVFGSIEMEPRTDWSGWFQIQFPGKFSGDLTVCSSTPDHLQLFGVGTEGQMYTQYWLDAEGWSNWHALGGLFDPGTNPAAICRKPGIVEVFGRGKDNTVYQNYWPHHETGDWSGWFQIQFPGKFSGDLAVCSSTPDHLQLFGVGTDGQMYTQYWLDAEGWSNWHALGGLFDPGTNPAAICRKPGTVEVFCRGKDNTVYQNYWPHHETGDWSGWFQIQFPGKFSGDLAVCSSTPDHLQLFGVGTDGQMYTQYWLDAEGWSNWHALGGLFDPGTNPAAICRKPGTVEVFCRGKDNTVYQNYWPHSSDQ